MRRATCIRAPVLLVLGLAATAVIASWPSAAVGEATGDSNSNRFADDDNWNLRRQRRRPVAQSPLDAVSWLNLRRFVCGGGDANVRCLTDERYTHMFTFTVASTISGVALAIVIVTASRGHEHTYDTHTHI